MKTKLLMIALLAAIGSAHAAPGSVQVSRPEAVSTPSPHGGRATGGTSYTGNKYQPVPVTYNHPTHHRHHDYQAPRHYYAPQVVSVSNTLTISSPAVQVIYQSGPEVVVYYQQYCANNDCPIPR